MDYTTHSFILSLLVHDTETVLTRLQDVITMEKTQYNSTAVKASTVASGRYKTFDIDRSYTVLRIEVEGSLNSVLPVPRIGPFDPYKIDRVMYRGY